MKAQGVGLLAIAIVVLGAYIIDAPSPSVSSQGQMAALEASVTSSGSNTSTGGSTSGSYNTQSADDQCPNAQAGKTAYNVSKPIYPATYTDQNGKTIQNLYGKLCSSNMVKGYCDTDHHCLGVSCLGSSGWKDCKLTPTASNTTGTQTDAPAPGSSTQTPPAATPPASTPAPATGAPPAATPPANASAPATGATPTGVAPSAPTNQPINQINGAITNGLGSGGGAAPITGTGGSAPATTPFSGTAGLNQTTGMSPAGGAAPTGVKATPYTGTGPQSASTFGGVPYRAPAVSNTGYLSAMSSFISAINPLSVIASGIDLVTSIISSASASSNSSSNTVVVQQPVRVVGQTSGSTSNTAPTGTRPAPQIYVTINGSTTALPSEVNQIALLLQQGLFVQASGHLTSVANSGGPLPISGLGSNVPSATSTDNSAPTTIEQLVASIRAKAQLLNSQSGTSAPSQNTTTLGQDMPLGSQPFNGGMPGSLISVATSSAGAGFTYVGPSAVDVGGPSDIGKPWSLLVGSLGDNWSSGGASDSSSPLIQEQAALAQTLSNYDGIRAQIQELQQAKDAGICDMPCQHTYDTLVLQLPLQRAAVNALNNVIDNEITGISNKSFAAGLPIVSIAQSGLPSAPPFVSSDHMPPDLSGLMIASGNVPDVFSGGVFSGNSAGNANAGAEGTGVVEGGVGANAGNGGGVGAGGENGANGSVIGGGNVTTNLPSAGTSAVSHDPFEKPIFVLDNPWIFTPPATGTAVLDSSGAPSSTGFQSLSGQSDIVQVVTGGWQQLTDWFSGLFVQDTSKPCSLIFSLFGMCNK